MSYPILSVLESDRARELLAKVRVSDTTNKDLMSCLVEEYKDVLDAVECALQSTGFDNVNSTREHFSRLLPTEGPNLPLAENTHQSTISEENTGPPTALPNKNTRPLPPSIKELQKMKYAAVKVYSRYPTPENKEIMQALNRETKRKIAEFKRTSNNSTGMKLSPRREVKSNIVQHQMNHFDDEDVDVEESDDEDTDNKDNDKEDIENNEPDTKVMDEEDTVNEETKDEYRRRLGDEYQDVIEWAERLSARALRAYAYTAESQTLSVSSETWGLHDDYMSARFNFYMSKMEANFTTEERRQKAQFSIQYMSWIRNLEQNLKIMLPSPAADIRSLPPPVTNKSQALPLDDNASQSFSYNDIGNENNDNEDTDVDVMDNEDTKSKQSTKDEYRLLNEEYKDIMEWAEELRKRALRATSVRTSKALPVSSDTETWTPLDAFIASRFKEFLSKDMVHPPVATEERRQHNSGLGDDFKNWLFECGKNIILLFPSAANAAFLSNASTSQTFSSKDQGNKDTDNESTGDEGSQQATQRSQRTFTESTSRSQPVANFRSFTDPETIAEVEEISRQQHLTESTNKLKPSEENINQPLRNKGTGDNITCDEDSCDEYTDDEVTGSEDTDDEDTDDGDTDDNGVEPPPPHTKNATQLLSPVANTRQPLVVAQNASKPLPTTGYINRSQPLAKNTNQFLPPVASTSRYEYLPLDENTSLNSRRSQPPDTRPLPLKDYSRFPSPDNQRILRDLEREAKRRIAEFRRMEHETAAIGDRFDVFCSRLKDIDLNNGNQVNNLAEDFEDILEVYFSHGGADNNERFTNLIFLEYTRRSDPRARGASRSQAVPPTYPNVLPPVLQELLRRKRAALMIYRGCRSSKNRGILRTWEKEVKKGLAEFRR